MIECSRTSEYQSVKTFTIALFTSIGEGENGVGGRCGGGRGVGMYDDPTKANSYS